MGFTGTKGSMVNNENKIYKANDNPQRIFQLLNNKENQ